MDLNLTEVLAERPTKTVYRDGNKTVKLFTLGYKKSNVLNEALNHSRVEENTNLLIPKLLEVSTNGGRWAIVTEFVEGKSLQDLLSEQPEREDEYLSAFVKLQMKVLGQRVPLLSMLGDKCKRKLSEADIDDNVRFELMHRLDGFKRHTKLCHGDFNPANIIVDNKGKYHIIDWAHASQGNASFDAANTYLMFLLEGKAERAEKYLKLFCSESTLARDNVLAWVPIVAATRLEKASEAEKTKLEQWVNVVDFQ